MNPAKRKKLYRMALAEEKKAVVADVKPAPEPKKEPELGLKQMPAAEPAKVEAPVEEKLTVQGELVSVLEPVTAPVDAAADSKKKKKV